MIFLVQHSEVKEYAIQLTDQEVESLPKDESGNIDLESIRTFDFFLDYIAKKSHTLDSTVIDGGIENVELK